MIKPKDIDVAIDNFIYHFGIDYESEDGLIYAVGVNDVDILPIIRESVLNRIIDVFNGSFEDE